MARRTAESGRVQSLEVKELPFRPVRDWPTSVFIDEVVAHLKTTAQPETCDLLYRNKLPRTTKFRKVRPVELDQRKRPEGDLAPCPMCTTNRFLSGSLVFIPALNCCAVIGHCCASKEARDEAEREYKRRTQRDHEETLLLTNLPLLGKRADLLTRLRPAAEEARRIYRRFRRDAPTIHGHLRQLKARRGCHLSVSEEIEREDHEDSIELYGPRGLGRPGEEQTREIEIGVFKGGTAVTKDYNPVKELDDIIRMVASLEAIPSEEAALDFIVTMTEQQRRAAVAIIEGIDSSRRKLVSSLYDFARFFAKDNIELINTYGCHSLNQFPIEAEHLTVRGTTQVSFKHWDERCTVVIGPQVHDIDHDWPQAA
jgi:hypothetical protein